MCHVGSICIISGGAKGATFLGKVVRHGECKGKNFHAAQSSSSYWCGNSLRDETRMAKADSARRVVLPSVQRKVPKKKRKGLPPSQENQRICLSDTEGGGDRVIAMVNTLDEQQRWARWVECRLPLASHKKYHHAAALKGLEPGDDFRHHVGVMRPLQVEDAVSYGRNRDH